MHKIFVIFITTFLISYVQIDKTKIEVENNVKNEIDSIYKKEKEYLDQNIDIILDYIRHQKKQTIKTLCLFLLSAIILNSI
jgi:hypothetical protein